MDTKQPGQRGLPAVLRRAFAAVLPRGVEDEPCASSSLLWVNVPCPRDDLGTADIALNVAYAFAPLAYVLAVVLQCALLVLQGWPRSAALATDDAVKRWQQAERRQMRLLCGNLKVFMFSLTCLGVAVLQEESFTNLISPAHLHNRRRSPSCTAMFAIGLLAISLVDLVVGWAFKALTYQKKYGEQPIYTEVQLERLGYRQITTNEMFCQASLILITMGPVPWSRHTLGDATYAQAFAGSVEGLILGIAFHVGFTWLLAADGARRCHWLQRRILIPVLQWRYLICMGPSEPFPGDASLPWTRGCTDAEEMFIQKLEILRKEHRDRVQQESKEYEREVQKLQEEVPPALERRLRGKGILQQLEEEESWRTWSVLQIPGLEFLGVRNDTIFHTVAQTERELENLELANQMLKEAVEDANADLMNQQRELKMQRQESEILMQRCESERSKATKEHKDRLQLLEEDWKRTQSKQQSDLKMSQMLHKEAMAEAANDLAKARKESKAQLEAEKKRQGVFVQQLITFTQALTKLLDAVKNGDRKALETENTSVKNLKGGMKDEAIQALADPIIAQAEQTKGEWLRRLGDLHEALDKARSYEGSDSDKLSQSARQLFNAVVAAIDKGLRLCIHDKDTCDESEKWMFDRWLTCVAKNHNGEVGHDVRNLHKRILHKAVFSSKEELGTFDFTDLEVCLETVDCAQKAFIDSAKAQIEHNAPRSLSSSLSQLNALSYFLKYLEMEDLHKTKDTFDRYLSTFGGIMGSQVMRWVHHVSMIYDDSNVLLRPEDLPGIRGAKPSDVIRTMSRRRCRVMGKFHDIFCRLSKTWEQDFKILAVPHHTQIFALLVFKTFLEDPQTAVRTLIAQVSTGEGKSMLIAALAIFICVSTRKRVHIVIDDKKLLLRDFENFRTLFRDFASEVAPRLPPERFAVACDENTRNTARSDIVTRIPDDAWIVYCQARHVTSYYAQKARRGELNQTTYDDHVLILDEVDALVIDQDPTEEFVYDVAWRVLERGITIGEYATALGRFFAVGQICSDEMKPQTEEEKQIYGQVMRLFHKVNEWRSKPKKEQDAEFQVCVGAMSAGGGSSTDRYTAQGLYVRMENGKVVPHYNSNFLECLRLNESPDMYKMRWFERLFVMSKPRVFRRYSRIVGLSGTVGNEWEQGFLQKAYGAQFFVVPPFLETCRGVDFHTAQWAGAENAVVAGQLRQVKMYAGMPGPAVVLANAEDQYQAVKALAFEVRKMVPVLVVAASPEGADEVVDRLRQHARSALAGCNPSDLVRSMSQREYDRNAGLYKESLRASTRTLSRNASGPKEFRITVTDPTGARGTDYQMFDEDADKLGGLMLIVMHVPPSMRDWIQYKGRTARQQWRGQYCVVLNAEEYRLLDGGKGEALPRQAYGLKPGSAPFAPRDPEELVKQILEFGSKQSARRLMQSNATYNAGFVTNEVCELVWQHPGWCMHRGVQDGRVQVDVNLQGVGRTAFLDICARYRHMSAEQIAKAARIIEGPPSAPGRLDFNLDRDSEVPDRCYEPLPAPKSSMPHHKAVLFIVDVSGSMTAHKIGAATRLDVCKQQIQQILVTDGILAESDQFGVVAFGAGYRRLIPSSPGPIVGPMNRGRVQTLVDRCELEAAQVQTMKEYGQELRHLERPEVDLRRKQLGIYTFLYSTLCTCAEELMHVRGDFSRWIILLSDGDDSGSGKTVVQVREALDQFKGRLNLIIITVGSEVTTGSILQGFTDTVRSHGAVGTYIAASDEHDDSALKNAFAQVEESLLLDCSGQVEVDHHEVTTPPTPTS